MSKNYNVDEKNKYIKKFEESKLSVKQFVRENGIKYNIFVNWLKEERNKKFGKIDIETTTLVNQEVPKIILTSKSIKIELNKGYDKVFLKNVLEVLIND